MAPPSSHDVTRLLRDWRNGDQQALEKLTPLVYDELRRLARNYLRRERPDHTLQATALINEAYLQLIGRQQTDWESRAHFIGVAATLMREGRVRRSRLGLAGQTVPVDRRILRTLQRQVPTAILIVEVQRGGAAERATLEQGDVLLDFDGVAIAGLDHLHRLLTADLAAREVGLRVLRRGKLVDARIRPTLG